MICAGTLICTSLLTRCMTTPQKVTKKRLVAYIDPEIYEFVENDSKSNNCSISKSTEKILLYLMKENPQIVSQTHTEFQNIELTVLGILSHLPEDIVEKLSEQITSTLFFQERDVLIHAVPAQTGTEPDISHTQVVLPRSVSEIPEPSVSMTGSLNEDQISARYGTDQHGIDIISDNTDHEKHLPYPGENYDQNEVHKNNLLQFCLSIDPNISADSSINQTQQIAVALKQYMQNHNLTQRSFKTKYGIDVTKMNNWILGTRSMNLNTIMKILQIINSPEK